MRLKSKLSLVVAVMSVSLMSLSLPRAARAFGLAPGLGTWSMANYYRGSLSPFYGTPFLPSYPQYMTGQMPAYYPQTIWGSMSPSGSMMMGGGMMGMPMTAGMAF
jgi:hypothetical protein